MKKTIRNSIVFVVSGAAVLINSFMTTGSMRRATASTADMKEIEGPENSFQVILPTGTDEVFNFIMDPQELICKTEAAAYGDYTFEKGATVFFKRMDEDAQEDYTSSSDVVVITNMGAGAVEIKLNASISSEHMQGITMANDIDFTDDTNPSLYLALTDGSCEVPIDMEEGASIYTTLEGVLEEEGEYNNYYFQLLGAVNKNGDWSQLTDIAPKVTVTWSVSPKEEIELMGEPVILREDGEPEVWEEWIREDTNKEEQEIAETLETPIIYEDIGQLEIDIWKENEMPDSEFSMENGGPGVKTELEENAEPGEWEDNLSDTNENIEFEESILAKENRLSEENEIPN